MIMYCDRPNWPSGECDYGAALGWSIRMTGTGVRMRVCSQLAGFDGEVAIAIKRDAF